MGKTEKPTYHKNPLPKQQRPGKIKKEQRNQQKVKAEQQQVVKAKIQETSQKEDPVIQQKEQKVGEKSSSRKQQQGEKKGKKHNRIIIRNLIVDINEKHLKKLLSPYGEIKEISIPKHPDKNISKGFAFVEFETKNQCHSAINSLNGTSFKGRTIILDFSIAKKAYLEQKVLQNQTEQKKQQKQQQKESQVQDEDKDNEKDEDQQMNQNQQQEIKQQPKQQTENDYTCTIFIRNLPTTVDDQALFNHFKKYGKIQYARVVINPQTKLSRGTGFVRFKDPGPAKQLIDESRSYELYLTKKLYHFESNPKINLQIDGKIIKIFDAMSRENLQSKVNLRGKQEEGKENLKTIPIKKIRSIERLVESDKQGKRNISLALEGIWRAEQTMNKKDYESFKSHQREKLQKLKNPNHFVSKTRVILKHLNKSMTEEQIRDLAIGYLRQNSQRPKQLKYCKLMLDNSMQKSAGFAFLEFSNHDLSLGFINSIKAHPEKVSKHPFICEFTIEDSRKLLKKNKKITKHSK